MRASPRASALASLVLLLGGCAHYTTSSGLIGGIRSVAIPLAENDTAEPDISEVLTERTTEALTVDGRLRVVDEESADAILYLRETSENMTAFSQRVKDDPSLLLLGSDAEEEGD